MKTDYKPQEGERFWHEEAYEYVYFERILEDGNWLCCPKVGRHKNDDYYRYKPNQLRKNGPKF